MEGEKPERVPYSGPGAEGRSLGANRTEAEKEQKVAEIKKKSRKKGAENNENCIVPLNVWAENPNFTEAVV
ncbi:MAG: hypothetical protein LM580_12270 [Thermofilum sp.]|nr:hypothetical protein [Thermofilum sp.]